MPRGRGTRAGGEPAQRPGGPDELGAGGRWCPVWCPALRGLWIVPAEAGAAGRSWAEGRGPSELYTRERRADHRRERGGGRGPSEVRLLA